MRGTAAGSGQDALGSGHALDVLGAGEAADQQGGAVLGVLLHVLSGEVDSAAAGAGAGGQAGGDGLRLLEGGLVEARVQQGVYRVGVYLEQRLFLGAEALVHHVDGDLEGGLGGALAVAGLEHVELALLYGELHVLHVLVVALEVLRDGGELVVGRGVGLVELVYGLGGADAGDDVLALGVHEELAVELVLAGGGVTGESDAGAAVVAHVAEDHHLDVDGGAPGAGDVVHAAVGDGAVVHPGAEHGADGGHELDLRVGRELFAGELFVEDLEALHHLLHILGGEAGVGLDAALFLELVHDGLELETVIAHGDVGEHHDEAAVAVVGPADVSALGGQGGGDVVVDAEVQDGVHHAGHGGAGAGTDGDQQRVFLVAELLADESFHLGQVLKDLGFDLGGDLLAVLIVAGAGLSAYREALGDRHSDIGHLGQVSALAAQQLAHIGVAFGKQVNVLFAHPSTSFQIYMKILP